MRTVKFAFIVSLFFFVAACADQAPSNNPETTPASNEISEDQDPAVKINVSKQEEDSAPEQSESTQSKTEETSVESTNKSETPKAVKVNQVQKVEEKEIEVENEPQTINEKVASEDNIETDVAPITSQKEDMPPVANQEAETEEEKIVEEAPVKKSLSHDIFDALLRKYVSTSGKVNYKGFKSEEAKLDEYLNILENNPPTSGWSKNKKMAYYINAYNAATIKLILKNHPVSSITKLHGGKPWDVKWIKLGDKTYTLNNIENDILRPIYKDARIHFAVNCAAKSCPPLLNKAWTESNLNAMLEKQTKSFINDPSQNSISAKEVKISKIFEWYAVDFENIIDYLNQYSNVKIKSDAKVTYQEYDWALND